MSIIDPLLHTCTHSALASVRYILTRSLWCQNPNTQFLTVPITSRVPTILADMLLIGITWKVLPEGFMQGNSRIETLKTRGLVWIMLCDGSSAYDIFTGI